MKGFIPERPSRAVLETSAGVHRLIDRAVAHVLENGGTCHHCSAVIDVQERFVFISGWPAPLYCCGREPCVQDLQRTADELVAPMLMVD
jgi:hypothetical protein